MIRKIGRAFFTILAIMTVSVTLIALALGLIACLAYGYVFWSVVLFLALLLGVSTVFVVAQEVL